VVAYLEQHLTVASEAATMTCAGSAGPAVGSVDWRGARSEKAHTVPSTMWD
jgi:hypothetical protein